MSLALPWANSRISLDEIQRRIKPDGALKPYFGMAEDTPLRKGQKYLVVASDEGAAAAGRVYGAAVMIYQGRKNDTTWGNANGNSNANSNANSNNEYYVSPARRTARKRAGYLYTFTSLYPPHNAHTFPMYRYTRIGHSVYRIAPMSITSSGYAIGGGLRAGWVHANIARGKISLGKIRRDIARRELEDMAARRIQRRFLALHYDPRTSMAQRRLKREFASLTAQ